MKIRSISITYSIKKSREERSLYRTLENDIQNLENIMNSSPDDVTQASLVHKKLELGKNDNKRLKDYSLDHGLTGMRMVKSAQSTFVN